MKLNKLFLDKFNKSYTQIKKFIFKILLQTLHKDSTFYNIFHLSNVFINYLIKVKIV